MVYFYLAQEKFRLAEYPMLNNYASESLSLANIEFKINQDWGGGEEDENDSNQESKPPTHFNSIFN
jgi:hypothetical protein